MCSSRGVVLMVLALVANSMQIFVILILSIYIYMKYNDYSWMMVILILSTIGFYVIMYLEIIDTLDLFVIYNIIILRNVFTLYTLSKVNEIKIK